MSGAEVFWLFFFIAWVGRAILQDNAKREMDRLEREELAEQKRRDDAEELRRLKQRMGWNDK